MENENVKAKVISEKNNMPETFSTLKSKHAPFVLVQRDNKHVITLANYQVIDREFNSFDECEEFLDAKSYELLINVVFTIISIYKQHGDKN